jgi:DNA-directed RNA polymerase subunit RPC12/RpoP
MEKLKEKISLRCTFCRSSEFALPYESYSPPSESFIVCANCGRENDVTSLLIVAKSTGLSIAKNYADKLVNEMKKDLIKIFGKK